MLNGDEIPNLVQLGINNKRACSTVQADIVFGPRPTNFGGSSTKTVDSIPKTCQLEQSNMSLPRHLAKLLQVKLAKNSLLEKKNYMP